VNILFISGSLRKLKSVPYRNGHLETVKNLVVTTPASSDAAGFGRELISERVVADMWDAWRGDAMCPTGEGARDGSCCRTAEGRLVLAQAGVGYGCAGASAACPPGRFRFVIHHSGWDFLSRSPGIDFARDFAREDRK